MKWDESEADTRVQEMPSLVPNKETPRGTVRRNFRISLTMIRNVLIRSQTHASIEAMIPGRG